ncbi:DUF4395 domain-containing protein [Runella sp.]|uniref:DUF4395 domain-containing protein n=1 Tax=Runella sp. TaxID=1960881 RepID=UPI003D11AE90
MSILAQNQPLHQAQVNENKVRVTAFLVLILVILYAITRWPVIAVLLVVDFGLRGFDLGKFSPLAFVSDWIVKALGFPVKPIYYPPKRFSARIGLGFSIAIVILHFGGWDPLIVSAVLGFFAALESLAGFCAGCYMYDLLVKLKWI